MRLSPKNKRLLVVSGLLFTIGILKIARKGIYQSDGSIDWWNIISPAGLGLLLLITTFIFILTDRK